jgi:hypothetical protein
MIDSASPLACAVVTVTLWCLPLTATCTAWVAASPEGDVLIVRRAGSKLPDELGKTGAHLVDDAVQGGWSHRPVDREGP